MKQGLVILLLSYSLLGFAQTKKIEGRLDASGKPVAQLEGDFVSFKRQNQFAIARFDGKIVHEGIKTPTGLLTADPLRIDYGVYFEKEAEGLVLNSITGGRLNEAVFSKYKPFRTSNTVVEITDEASDKSYAYIDTLGQIFARYDMERYYRIFGINIHEGYHNTDGYIAKSILFTDDNFRLYSEGLLALQHPENGLWGFVDSTMKIRIAPKYNDVGPFSEGKAAFKNVNGLWGYIDTEGETVVAARFSLPPSRFSSQRARVQNTEGQFGYIDRAGNIVIQPQYASATNFYKGYALVRVNGQAPIRLIDQSGTVLAQFDAKYQYFDSASGKGMWNARPDPFHTAETLIQLVEMGKGVFHNGKHYGILSKSGEIILPFEYAYIKDYKGGRLLGIRSSFVQGKLKNEYYLMNDKGEAYIQFIAGGF